MQALVTTGRWLTLAGYFGLMAGFYAWIFVLNENPSHSISILLIIQIGPLLFPLTGLLQGRIYTHAWSIYLAIAYFVAGVWYSSAAHSLGFGLYITGMSLSFMVGAAMYTRYASIHARNQQAADQDKD